MKAKAKAKVNAKYRVQDSDDCAKLKRDIVVKIVGERIYKAEQLEELYATIVKEHPRLPKQKLQVMWQEIIAELNA